MVDFRNKYLVNTIRILLGVFFIFSGASGLYSGTHNMAGVPSDMVPATQVLWNTGIFPLVKITEIIAGLMLVVGFLPWLAAIFLAPICVGAIVDNLLMAPQYTPVALFAAVLTAYLGYAYWEKYKPLFERKQ